MVFNFDSLGFYGTPTLTLANPQRNQTYVMAMHKDLKPTICFNAVSELTFTVSYIAPYYDKLVMDRLVKMEGFGWFVIISEKEENDGFVREKKIKCYSYEHTLNWVSVEMADGTYQFYDPISPEGTLLRNIADTNPPWTVGYVSSSLYSKWRTFEISDDVPVYSFLMNEVEAAYECIFEFDTENMVINVYDTREAVSESDIVLTFDNLLKNTKVESDDTGIITALQVVGDSTLDITTVNPLGTAYIYNFSYFKTTDFMTQPLIDALDAWEAKVAAQQPGYAGHLTTLKIRNSELIRLQGELADLEADYVALEITRTERIVQGQTNLTDITGQIRENERQQNAVKQKIVQKQQEIDALQGILRDINTSLRFENNFTPPLLAELRCFQHYGQHKNENFGVLESMDAGEIQDLAQELYDQGLRVHEKLCQPVYTFTLEAVNFAFLTKYKTFIRRLAMGSAFHVEIRDGLWFKPVLLKMELNYDDPTEFKLTFSNRLRLSDAEWTFAELQNDESRTTGKVFSNMSSLLSTSRKMNEVLEWKNSALDLVKQQIQSTDNQEFLLDQFGLWGRRINAAQDGYEDDQIRLTNNVLAFTNDNWQNVKLAIGKIPNPSTPNNYVYGLIADVLVGDLIAGSNLLITNENSTVRIDGSGATLTNCKLTVTRSDNKAQIVIDPNVGFKMQKKPGNSLTDVVCFDVDGNAVFQGTIHATDGIFSGELRVTKGTIGGWTIQPNQLRSNYGDYISSLPTGSNGQLGQLGLFSWGQYPSTGIKWARFDGEVNANQISGYIPGDKFQDEAIDGLKIKRHSIRGSMYTGIWSHIAVGTIGNLDIGTGAVSTNELASFAVTSAKIGQGAVGGTQLASGSVSSTHLGFDVGISTMKSDIQTIKSDITSIKQNITSLQQKLPFQKTTSMAGNPMHSHTMNF